MTEEHSYEDDKDHPFKMGSYVEEESTVNMTEENVSEGKTESCAEDVQVHGCSLYCNVWDGFPSDSCLPFFENGCRVKRENFTCAPDSLYSLIESVLVRDCAEDWRDSEHPLLIEAKKILNYRVGNLWSWNHDL